LSAQLPENGAVQNELLNSRLVGNLDKARMRLVWKAHSIKLWKGGASLVPIPFPQMIGALEHSHKM
jgi:hypothetical protein